MPTNFVAVDGESITEDGEHKYVLMRSSAGDSLVNRAGITTEQALEWLLHVGRRIDTKRNVLVGFGFNYDVNMFLRDVDFATLSDLWDYGDATWRDYELSWIPSKFITIRKGKRYVRVNDVFGFFQSSFVRALESWDVPDPDGDIARMKAERSSFTWAELDAVSWYCFSECRLLVDLMGKLETALLTSGVDINRWYGAGCIANRILHKNKISALHRYDSEVEYVGDSPYNAIMSAYFGGRIELFKQGEFRPVTSYDIRSAYPAITAGLPDLHGAFMHTREYDPDAKYAVWHVRWNVDPDDIVMPFPVRYKTRIYYPSEGEGYYWQDEVREAMRYYDIEVVEGWIYEPEVAGYPMQDLISDLWAKRAAFKATDPGAYKAVKLGINSLYGKFAQGLAKKKKPRFQSYVWAGLITSGTRATLLRYGLPDRHSLIAFATDSLTFDTEVELPVGDDLGELERSDYAYMFTAQPGMYLGRDDEGNEVFRTRGFMTREIDWNGLIDGFRESAYMYDQHRESTRFVGIGGAIHRKNARKVWRTWQTEPRVLSLMPSIKTPEMTDTGAPVFRGGSIRHFPPGMVCNVSEPYRPKLPKGTLPVDMLDEMDSPNPLLED